MGEVGVIGITMSNFFFALDKTKKFQNILKITPILLKAPQEKTQFFKSFMYDVLSQITNL